MKLIIGLFSPKNNQFDDCIIHRLFTYIKIEKPKLLFTVSKNFPYEAGLGSASSNVATVIKILENLEIIKKRNIFDYVNLGSDVPFFLNQKDALIRGKGDLIRNMHFPKYYFLLIKPSFKCSTKIMYESFKPSDLDYISDYDLEEINEQDTGNDFEKILKKNEPEFLSIINYLDNFEDIVFSRLTGSGSCIFSVFEKKRTQKKKNLLKNFLLCGHLLLKIIRLIYFKFFLEFFNCENFINWFVPPNSINTRKTHSYT